MKFLIYFLTFVQLLAINLEAGPLAPVFEQNISQKAERVFIEDIEQAPLILGNHDLSYNSLQGSVYELLNNAQESILINLSCDLLNLENKKSSQRL